MDVIDLFKSTIPLLSREDLKTLRSVIDYQLSPEIFQQSIRVTWVSRGRLAAIKEFRDYEGHITKPGLKYSKDVVESLCKDIPAYNDQYS